jgi:hypothetical protein
MLFYSKVMDKIAIKQLISSLTAHFGIIYTTHILDQLKNGIFHNFICFSLFSFKNCFSKFKILFLLRFKKIWFFSSSLWALWPEDLRISLASSKTFQGPPHGFQVERDKLNKHSGPLLRCIFKPKLGLSTKNHVGTLLSIVKRKMKTFKN